MSEGKSRILPTCEWVIAGIITALTLVLHLTRLRYAGPLWRDEIAAVHLARMKDWSEILKLFPHEAFPLLFPAILRGYTSFAGDGQMALRIFGFLVGLICLAALWLNCRLARQTAPLVGLSLFGLSPLFFIWGDSVRGYGLGAALIMLTFGLFARTIIRPDAKVFCAALLGAILSVHCLLANAVLLLAIGLSATAAQIWQRRGRAALLTLGIGLIAGLSIAPYFAPYHDAREWDIVLRTNVDLSWLFNQFCSALNSPGHGMVRIWLFLVVGSVIGLAWVARSPSSANSPGKAVALFSLSSCFLAVVFYAGFLKVLRYSTQEWYYIALIAVLIAGLDLITGFLAGALIWARSLRLIVILSISLSVSLRAIGVAPARMTNIDLIAQDLKSKAGRDDFVVVLPWYLGISFQEYFQSNVPWETIPMIGDLTLHRYDLAKEQMASPDPLGSVMQRMERIMKSGHRLWIVSPVGFVPTDTSPYYLAPAPYDPVGWSEAAYRDAWASQVAYFVNAHALRRTVSKAGPRLVNPFEKVELLLVEGWRDQH